MKKTLLLLLSISIITSHAQTVISFTHLNSYNPAQVDSFYQAYGLPSFILPITYGVDAYKLVYTTLDKDSLPTIASGAMFFPQGPMCHVPLACYAHGTILRKDDVPSTLQAGEVLIGISLASDGYVCCMPDYIGMGDSPGFHPYVHAATEARACADMLVAAIHVCDSLAIQRSNQLFLLGYSQGGHAIMAAQQLIEESYSSQMTVTADAPMSGPYDLSGVQAQVVSAEQPYPSPGYLPYLLFAYNDVYHLYANYSDYLVSPYDVTLPPLFDGTHDLGEVDAIMPSIPNDIIKPDVLDSFNTVADYPLRVRLRENNTYNFLPVAPIRMFYCEGDNDVNYMNAFVAYDTLTSLGATNVTKMSSGAGYDHQDCAVPSLLNAKTWFDSLRIDKIKITITDQFASSFGATDGFIAVQPYSGYPPFTYQWSNGDTDSLAENIATGNYSVTITDATGCPATFSIHLGYSTGIEELYGLHVELFPNPFTDKTLIRFSEKGNYTLVLQNLSGQQLFQSSFTGDEFELKRNQLPAGIYLLQLQKDDLPAFVKLISIQ